MIRRWLFRGAAPAAARAEVRAEAQIDLRDGQIEGLRDALAACRRAATERIAELERENIQLKAKLRVAEYVQQTPQWMATGRRDKARASTDVPTRVLPAELFRRSG